MNEKLQVAQLLDAAQKVLDQIALEGSIPGPWSENNLTIDSEGNHRKTVIATTYNQADAEFIVRACNAHEELLAAAETASSLIGNLLTYVELVEFKSRSQNTLDRLQKAIAKADGRS